MHRYALLALALVAAPAAAQQPDAPAAAQQTLTVSAFAVEHAVTVPGTPAEAFDAITGDLLPWWDHRFSENPVRLYLEPRPGGCFCEVFDAEGNGARHATVTFVQRGRKLIFEGALGLTGNALHMAHTYEFAAHGDSTRVTVRVRAVGEMQPGWAAAVNGVWRHFLVERFKPWYERTRGRRD
jgi:hypothetical protein